MTRLPKILPTALSPRQWFTLGILTIALILFTLLSAPANPRSDGSTYSKSPEGYGAWYAYVERSGQDIDRLRKPLSTLFETNPTSKPTANPNVNPSASPNAKPSANPSANPNAKPSAKPTRKSARTTLIHIAPGPVRPVIDRQWIAQGNRAILIGTEQQVTQVTDANFYSEHSIPIGTLKIATTRRYIQSAIDPQWPTQPTDSTDAKPQILVADRHGSLIWRTPIGNGEIIYILPTFLAANAYQDEANNFAYLKSLTQGDRIIMDEYIHGYRDSETAEKEGKGDLFTFFAKTPIALLLLQTMVILGVLIYGKNWRFGAVRALVPPAVNNSRAYIQALSDILQKANSSEFVTDTLRAAELKQLQRDLGLGTASVTPDTLLDAWTKKTGRPARDFQSVFLSSHRHKKLSEAELTQWLANLQKIQ